MEGFDIGALVEELKKAVKIKDKPANLFFDLMMNLPPEAAEGGGMPGFNLQQMQDKEGIKQLMKMAGMGEEDIDFTPEPIEGGVRFKFKDKKEKAKLKGLLEQVFKGDLLKKVFEQMFAAFAQLGDAMGDLMKDVKPEDEEGKKEE